MSANGNIVSVIGPLRKPKLMGFANDSFTLIVTPGPEHFCQINIGDHEKVVEDARQQAEQEGKGFFGQWAARYLAE
jgi:hypothetical protein